MSPKHRELLERLQRHENGRRHLDQPVAPDALLSHIGLTRDDVLRLTADMPRAVNVVSPERPSRVMPNGRCKGGTSPNALLDQIIKFAAGRDVFSVDDLPPLRARNDLNTLLHHYARRGYLDKVRDGQSGHCAARFRLSSIQRRVMARKGAS